MNSTHALIFGGKTWCRNFETRTMLDCHCYGQHSHKNESRTEIRCKPFIWAVFVLDKTCLYKWCSSCLIFPRINGLNVTDKLDCMSVASGQWLVLAVVNSSDWDTDYHTQSLQWLGQRDTENEGTLQQCMGHNSWQLALAFRRSTYWQSWHSRKTAAMIRAPCSTTKATMTWATNCFVGLRNFIAVIWAGCLGGLPFDRGRDARSLP